LRRYWIDSSDRTADVVNFTNETFHHIVNVCRQEVGSHFEVLPGDGKAYLVEMTDIRKKDAHARVMEVREVAPLPIPHIHLAVSVPRFATFDTILEKAAELGVAKIIPFTSEFSFVRDLALLEKKAERWEKIVRGACQQSGRGNLMELSSSCTLGDLLKEFNQKRTSEPIGHMTGLFPFEGEATQNIQQALRAIKGDPREVWVFVGSEGGFSSKEVELFQQFGLGPMTLGPQVLRVETACLALVAIIRYELGQLS
jgi:16S rRNA (uracil1498-N3)-methyltransferase